MVYKGYKIEKRDGGFIWTDDRNWTHWQEGMTKVPFSTVEDAKASIDSVCNAMHPDRP